MNIWLDGRYMTTRDNAHDHLAEQLAFPGWYGRNLDALYDLLTAGCPFERIYFSNSETMLSSLGAYGRRLMQALQDAAEDGGPALVLGEPEDDDLL